MKESRHKVITQKSYTIITAFLNKLNFNFLQIKPHLNIVRGVVQYTIYSFIFVGAIKWHAIMHLNVTLVLVAFVIFRGLY